MENEKQKILIAGLGAIGSIYATKFYDAGFDVKVLVDNSRYEKYMNEGLLFNGKRYDFEYILPDNKDFLPDLIIIAVKSINFDEIVQNIRNFVSKNVVILSLLNGISSENVLMQKYPESKVLKSYYVGHASMRNDRKVTYDGIGKIVLEKNNFVKELLEKAKITYEIPEDIDSSMWQKFIINIGLNQTTAIMKKPYSCFRYGHARGVAKDLMTEGVAIAKALGIKGTEDFIENAFKFIDEMPGECKTSMMQDVENKRKSEVDIFAGDVCRMGEELGIDTPMNYIVFRIIKSIEEEY